jgi:hypothetical protein
MAMWALTFQSTQTAGNIGLRNKKSVENEHQLAAAKTD